MQRRNSLKVTVIGAFTLVESRNGNVGLWMGGGGVSKFRVKFLKCSCRMSLSLGKCLLQWHYRPAVGPDLVGTVPISGPCPCPDSGQCLSRFLQCVPISEFRTRTFGIFKLSYIIHT